MKTMEKNWFEDEKTYYFQCPMPKGYMKKLVEIAQKIKNMSEKERNKYLNEIIFAYKDKQSNEIKFRNLNSFEKKLF